MNGTNGIWASVCAEGATMGHTSSCSTVVHLARLGNKRVLQKFNCQYLRQAAINVTRLTTGREPHAKQLIYGKRALDLVLEKGNDKFDVAAFFGEEMPMRICTVSSPSMICTQLINFFGQDEQFTEETASKMLEVMLDDLRKNRYAVEIFTNTENWQ